MTRIARVAVAGFGTMGRGIAQVVAASGRHVTVLEADDTRLADGYHQLDAFLNVGVERGKTTETERDEILARIAGTTDVAELARHDLVIEAVVEDEQVKRQLWREIDQVVDAATILATNTSALSVTDLAAHTTDPTRFAGLHFFNPAPLMPIVEIVHALQTDAQTIETLRTFCSDIGKDPIVVADRPGFLINRLLLPYLNDVIQAYDDGLASAEDIDTAIELGLGYKMGPMRLLDLIGLDVHHGATTAAYQQLRDSRFAPPPLLERMVDAGYLGDKAGRGLRAGDGINVGIRDDGAAT